MLYFLGLMFIILQNIFFLFLLLNVPVFFFSCAIVEHLLFSGSQHYVVQF